MRRAVPVPEDSAGFADDPADGGEGVAFLGALPLDEDGAALGGEGEAGLEKIVEEFGGLQVKFGRDFLGIELGGFDAQAGKVVPEALRDVHVLAIPGEVEAFEEVDARLKGIGQELSLVGLTERDFRVLGLGQFVLLGAEELYVQGDFPVLGHGAELEGIGVDGFIPIRFQLRGLSDDRHGGERGEGEEGAAFHGGGGGSARWSLGDAGQDGWEMSDCRNANGNAGVGKGKVSAEWEVPSEK